MRDITSETFDAVLFDSDGTLVDSREAIERAWTAWAIHYQVPAEAFGDFHGHRSRAIVAQVAPHLDLDEATSDIDRREAEDTGGVIALPGAAQALAAVGELAAVVTSAGTVLAQRRLTAAGISPPAVLISADEVTRGKPDPEPYLTGAERLGVDPARCLVVEDSITGARAGRSAGAAVLGVTAASNPGPGGVREVADLVLPDLSHVQFTRTDAGIQVTVL